MRCRATKTVVVTLELDAQEAVWLKCVMQNPLGGLSPEEEQPEEATTRHTLFHALKQVLEEVQG